MVTLKCKKCDSSDVTATQNGFVCENCKSVYRLDEVNELIKKEPELCEAEANFEQLNAKKNKKKKIIVAVALAQTTLSFSLKFSLNFLKK